MQRLLDDGAAPPLDTALAWALKDACYAAWNTEPSRAAQAAELLAQGLRITPPGSDRREIESLAAWTRGIAAITRGQMAEAVRAFDDAAQGLPASATAAARTRLERSTHASSCRRSAP